MIAHLSQKYPEKSFFGIDYQDWSKKKRMWCERFLAHGKKVEVIWGVYTTTGCSFFYKLVGCQAG